MHRAPATARGQRGDGGRGRTRRTGKDKLRRGTPVVLFHRAFDGSHALVTVYFKSHVVKFRRPRHPPLLRVGLSSLLNLVPLRTYAFHPVSRRSNAHRRLHDRSTCTVRPEAPRTYRRHGASSFLAWARRFIFLHPIRWHVQTSPLHCALPDDSAALVPPGSMGAGRTSHANAVDKATEAPKDSATTHD